MTTDDKPTPDPDGEAKPKKRPSFDEFNEPDPESWDERPSSQSDVRKRYENEKPPHHGG